MTLLCVLAFHALVFQDLQGHILMIDRDLMSVYWCDWGTIRSCVVCLLLVVMRDERAG